MKNILTLIVVLFTFGCSTTPEQWQAFNYAAAGIISDGMYRQADIQGQIANRHMGVPSSFGAWQAQQESNRQIEQILMRIDAEPPIQAAPCYGYSSC